MAYRSLQPVASTSSNGTGFLALLAILFIGLKLGGVIAWSWWWVLAPLWIPAVIGLAIVGVVLAVAIRAR